MSNAILYNINGQIMRSISAPPDMLQDQKMEGEFLLEGIADLEKDYILNNMIVPRPIQLTTLDKLTLIADGIDTIMLSNTPSGIFIATNTRTHETITGAINGTDTFSTTITGTYNIRIEAFPYLDFEATIEAI